VSGWKPEFRDHLGTSKIDDSDKSIRQGCARLHLSVKTWLYFHPAGAVFGDVKSKGGLKTVYWTVHDWPDGTQRLFRDTFKAQIETAFGNGAFWIAHNKRGVRDIWCDVTIDWALFREDADLCVNAVYNPIAEEPAFGWRSNCFMGGAKGVARGRSTSPELNKRANTIDMHISHECVTRETRRTKPTNVPNVTATFSQKILLHEFGHYLGLDHHCHWAGGDSEQYCTGRTPLEQDDLMAVGNQIRDHHASVFASRLGKHNYPPPKPAPTIESMEKIGDAMKRRAYRRFGFAAKNINDPGGGDRGSRPWKGTPWDATIETITTD
jgi:hypothetical protein